MRIALVDDDANAQAVLLHLLTEQIGSTHEITCFSGGEAFLEAWSAGRYELVILDIFMGSLSGMDVARRIRRTDGDVRLVFATSSNEFASESYEVNASFYLRKPFGAPEILQYENMQTRIADARRAKHDVRHHIALMQSYLKSGTRAWAALGAHHCGEVPRPVPL